MLNDEPIEINGEKYSLDPHFGIYDGITSYEYTTPVSISGHIYQGTGSISGGGGQTVTSIISWYRDHTGKRFDFKFDQFDFSASETDLYGKNPALGVGDTILLIDMVGDNARKKRANQVTHEEEYFIDRTMIYLIGVINLKTDILYLSKAWSEIPTSKNWHHTSKSKNLRYLIWVPILLMLFPGCFALAELDEKRNIPGSIHMDIDHLMFFVKLFATIALIGFFLYQIEVARIKRKMRESLEAQEQKRQGLELARQRIVNYWKSKRYL